MGMRKSGGYRGRGIRTRLKQLESADARAARDNLEASRIDYQLCCGICLQLEASIAP